MTITFAGKSYICIKAVRDGKNATFYLEDGGTVELIGVNDWGAIAIEGGTWTETPPDTITVPLASGLDGRLSATRQDGHLSLRCEATGPVVAGGIIAILPEGWRPTVPITAPAAIPGAAGATVTVSTDGSIRASAAGDGCWIILQGS